MEMEQAREVVESELMKISPFWRVVHRAGHLLYDDDKIVVCIIDFTSEIMVSMECDVGKINIRLATHNATPETIGLLFDEYKRIRGNNYE